MYNIVGEMSVGLQPPAYPAHMHHALIQHACVCVCSCVKKTKNKTDTHTAASVCVLSNLQSQMLSINHEEQRETTSFLSSQS